MDTPVEQLLARLVNMPTISDDAQANEMALDYIERYLGERGMYSQRAVFGGSSTLLSSTRADNQLTPTVLLSAHVDVVAGTEDQFVLRSKNGKLFGRGTYDMKFAIAGYMQLVDDLKQRLGDYDFGILIVADEETAGLGTKGHVQAGLRPQICILPDSTAPGWDIETTAKGYWCFDLIARGKAAHGGRPWEGESASFKLIQALHELKTYFEEQSADTDTLNIGQIHGGKAHNQVPAEMSAGIDIRYLNDASLQKKRKIVGDICKKYGVTIREIKVAAPVITDLGHPLIQLYQKSVLSITGRRPQGFISCAGTDAPYFQEEGINCIISCCLGGGHHTKNEWIDRNSFLQFVPILRHYLDETAYIPVKTVDAQAILV